MIAPTSQFRVQRRRICGQSRFQRAPTNQVVSQRAAAADSPQLVALRPAGDRTPLFCFHPIDGELGVYRQLVKQLPDDVPVFGFEAGKPHDGPGDLPRLANTYADAMLDVGFTEPYRLFGFSFGGIVAMHVAAALEDRGAAVEFVGVVDYCAIDADDWLSSGDLLANYIATVNRYYSARMAMVQEMSPEELRAAAKDTADHFLSDDCDTSTDAIVEYLSGSKLFVEGLRTDLIRPLVERLFARIPLMKTSRLRRISAPLFIWRGSDGIGSGRDGWRDWTESHCEESVLPANHLTVMQNPAVEMLAAELAELFERFDNSPTIVDPHAAA